MNCELKDLAIGYKTRKGIHTVATGISATIHGGALTCLLGENGVGKSTLLRTLSAFLPPLGGTIALDGRMLDSYDDAELAKTIGHEVEVSFSKKLSGGFKIGPKDGGYFISLTEESFRELVGEYMRPATKKILFG